ncbi:hypothetical protein HNP25_004409 [Arcicella rosea]|uniref:Uncharacterized protein n=1 Tax=Arcicella rosea TaxID=502909 RepID=A0A841EZF4_9BACT|nr:hypothetical protein [Arcicella rosea]
MLSVLYLKIHIIQLREKLHDNQPFLNFRVSEFCNHNSTHKKLLNFNYSNKLIANEFFERKPVCKK